MILEGIPERKKPFQRRAGIIPRAEPQKRKGSYTVGVQIGKMPVWREISMIAVTVAVLTPLFAIGTISPLLMTDEVEEVVTLDQADAPEEPSRGCPSVSPRGTIPNEV